MLRSQRRRWNIPRSKEWALSTKGGLLSRLLSNQAGMQFVLMLTAGHPFVRELAEQTHEAILSFMNYLPPPELKCALLTGGLSDKGMKEDLQEGVDIVTGTIGRIESLVATGKLSLQNIRFFVLDEADKLMERDNFTSIVNLYHKIPKEERALQVCTVFCDVQWPYIGGSNVFRDVTFG